MANRNSQAAFDKCPKVAGWAIDNHGRTRDLPWRCWKLTDDGLNTRERSFATREEAEAYPIQVQAWDSLPESIRETWKIDQIEVLKVTNKSTKTVQRYVAETATHRYTWTFMRSRFQWVVNKVAV
jgi:hypothetical protein